MDRPYASWITKLNVRVVQIIDVPEVKGIGDDEHRFSGLGLRVTARLRYNGGVETLTNGPGQRLMGKRSWQRRGGGWRGIRLGALPKVAPSVAEATASDTRFHTMGPDTGF